ncbi:hypothetical protein EMCRGX_G011546 [Ephydatia muelleri]
MPSRSKQRVEYLQTQDNILSQENKAKARARYKADPEKKASVRDSYKADPEKKKASVRDSYKADPERRRLLYKADPEKKKASVRDSYKADPEKKKASVRDSYKADPEKKRPLCKADSEKKRASVRDSYNPDIESKQSAKKQRYQEDLEENRAANTSRIQLPLGHLKGIGFGMIPLSDWQNVLPRGRGIAGITELPLPPKAQKVVTRSARAAVSKIGADALVSKALSVRRAKAGSLLKTIREVNALKLEENDILVGHGYHTAGSLPPRLIDAVQPPYRPPPAAAAAELPPPPAEAAGAPLSEPALLPAPILATTTSLAATLATATTTHMAPMAGTRLPRSETRLEERKRTRQGNRTVH